MISLSRLATGLLLVCVFLGGVAWGGGDRKPVLTHADAAVILAKYSGFFDRYVGEDADLNECTAFLNKTGIYFGLLEVVNGAEFTVEDCARAMGQINLVLSGDAEFFLGKVKLPKGFESWGEFCTMHGVEYVKGHRAMLKMLNAAGTRKEE
ncbi:MAG: hypothetical protein ABFR33_06440 [Verrucomicrobiota bacterium]